MGEPGWTPSIVPKEEDDQNVYIVLDDFGRNGRAYRETDVERADLEAVIMDMLEGEYKKPVRVVGFNTADGWPQDVSGDVAQELRHRRSVGDPSSTGNRPLRPSATGRSILPSGIHRPARRSLPRRPAAASGVFAIDEQRVLRFSQASLTQPSGGFFIKACGHSASGTPGFTLGRAKAGWI
jgi:hypothetical protein